MLTIDIDEQRRRQAELHPRQLNLRTRLPAVPVKLPELAKALDELKRLRQEAAETAQAETDAQADLRRAEIADRAAYASAIRTAKPDPGTPATDEARARLVDIGRKRSAISEALQEAEREARALVKDNQDAYLATIATAHKAVLADAAAALAEFERQRDRLLELERFTGWLSASKVPGDAFAADALAALRGELDRRANVAE